MRLYVKEGAWEEITRAANATREPSYVAVAYFGKGASKLLPLRAGSTLVVDLSDGAVRSGQTNPSELLKYKGVQIHSAEKLHAKVFVFGRAAIVGSANASSNSAQELIEAVIKSSDSKTVNACRRFVKSLRGEEVSPERLKQLEKIYRPPKGQSRRPRRRKELDPLHRPLWAVPLWSDWDETDENAYEAGRPQAEKKLNSKSRFEIDAFSVPAPGLRIQRGDRVLTMDIEPGGRKYLNPPGDVLDVGYYFRNRQGMKMIYYARVKGARARSLKVVRKKLGRLVKGLPQSKRSKKITDASLSHAILNLWYR